MVRSVSMVFAVAAFTLSVVTAAVTIARGQPAGEFRAVITNLKTGAQMKFRPKVWPGQYQCDAAIKGLDQWLKDIVGPEGSPTREATEADPIVKQSVERLAASILVNTGRMPTLGISCELQGDPA